MCVLPYRESKLFEKLRLRQQRTQHRMCAYCLTNQHELCEDDECPCVHRELERE